MEIERIPLGELADDSAADALAAEWDALRPALSTWSNPFYSSGYARMVAAERPQVEVGVVRSGGQLRAVLAYERSGRAAIPAGGGLSDFQGPVVANHATPSHDSQRTDDTDDTDGTDDDARALAADLTPESWLRGLRLNTWRFQYVPPVWQPLTPYRYFRLSAPYVDLSDGFATFQAAIAARGSDMMHRHKRGCRTFTKRLGPVRFEFDNRDPALLHRFLEWKAAQHAQRGTRFAFAEPWARRLLDRAFAAHDPAFRGTLACLFAGDHFVAGSFNLISGSTMHVWIAAFGPEYAKFSPGTNFFPELIMAAGAAGIKRLDFGHGDEPFKFRFGTCLDEVAEGCVDRRLLLRWSTRGRYALRHHLRQTELRPWLQNVRQSARRWGTRLGWLSAPVPTDSPTEPSSDSPTETPIETPAEISAGRAAKPGAEARVERRVEKPVERRAEPRVETPAQPE